MIAYTAAYSAQIERLCQILVNTFVLMINVMYTITYE